MCGIVGYTGTQQAQPILLNGLHRLEYRGYDSAGIAVGGDGIVSLVKRAGKVRALQDAVDASPLQGTWGIAHTRWATHGPPTEQNAHPHTDASCGVFVVHNGIIENHRELRALLEAAGATFTSQTDSEVLPHLIAMELAGGADFPAAVAAALQRVTGAYAVVAIALHAPGTLVAARLSSPLRIGIGDDEFIVASDPSAIITRTRQVVTLDDHELAVITQEGASILHLSSRLPQTKAVETVEWNLEQAQKDGHEHFMAKEIFEEPQVVADTLRGRLVPSEGKARLGGLAAVEERLRSVRRVILLGCGTAYHAGMLGECMLEEYGGVVAEARIASEFRYRKVLLDPASDAVLAISQSGETADTLEAVKEAKERGVLTLGICNVIGSSIAREVEAGMYNHAGPEISVASTKAFISQAIALALITLLLGRQRQLSLVMGSRIVQALEELPAQIEGILRQAEQIEAIAARYAGCSSMYFIGRKYNFPIALEGALKLKEISYIHAEGLASGELKHGPLALIEENVPSVCLAPQDSVYQKNVSNLAEIRARGGKVIVIATEGDEEIESISDNVLWIPRTLELLTPVLSVVPLQLLAYYMGCARGIEVDRPRNLAKSVTVE